MFFQHNSRLIRTYDHETLWVEPWGKNSVRIRATREKEMPGEDWALLTPEPSECTLEISDRSAVLINGQITVYVDENGKLTIANGKGEVLLEEYVRNRKQYTFQPGVTPVEAAGRSPSGSSPVRNGFTAWASISSPISI